MIGSQSNFCVSSITAFPSLSSKKSSCIQHVLINMSFVPLSLSKAVWCMIVFFTDNVCVFCGCLTQGQS